MKKKKKVGIYIYIYLLVKYLNPSLNLEFWFMGKKHLSGGRQFQAFRATHWDTIHTKAPKRAFTYFK